jgi:hypothetical protein
MPTPAVAQRAPPCPGLSREQHHLAELLGGLLPPLEQKRDLPLPAYERARGLCPGGAVTNFPDYTIERDRRVDALKGVGPDAPAIEEASDEPVGRAANHDSAGLGQSLQARRHVRRFAESQALPPLPIADVANDHDAGMNPYAHLERAAGIRSAARRESLDDLHDLQAGADGPPRIVFVCNRVAEVPRSPSPRY